MTPEPDLGLAESLFARLRAESFDGIGITRDTYGEGEGRAHRMLAEVAGAIGLETETDAAMNLYVTLPGADRGAPRVMTGSHLDSVPRGGNYDGAAGVLAGLAVLAGWRGAGFVPPADTTLMAVRAEESSWFPVSYVGSRAAFGILPDGALEAPRVDNGRPLAAHIAAAGGDVEALRRGAAHLDPARIARFVEVHIEQGPVLVDADEPLGLVTGIRGSFRYRSAAAHGTYAHSGGTPKSHRRDAVLATARLVAAMDDEWQRLEAEGRDLAVTFGRFATDPAEADFAKVAGLVRFCLDVRSFEEETLALVEDLFHGHVAAIGAATGVTFEIGPRTGSTPAAMDGALQDAVAEEARRLNLPLRRMPCGAGHDTAVFAQKGVPSAMIFIRNEHGSHNPKEAMAFDDFAAATRLLGRVLARA